MSYLGLDIGTTGSKAGLFDAEGRLLALAYREYPLLAPEPGWAEIDSAQVCRACLEVIREVAAACPTDPVRGVGISCQGEAFTPVGPGGELLGNGMVSSDARAVPIIADWCRAFGDRRLYELTGHTPHPMFTLFKLLWLRENRPDAWEKAEKFYCFEELIQTRLGLEPAISWPLAGRTMLFNVRTHRWEEEILARVGLDASRLAPAVPSGTVVGTIPSSVAEKLGLPKDVPVVAGGHDQPCGALGAGVVEPGLAMYATGTVECICPAFDRPIFADNLFESNLCTYDHTAGGMYTTVLFSLTGGNLLRWFRDEWGQPEVDEAKRTGADPYDLLIEGMPAEPGDPLVLPYFTPSGTPYFDAKVPGAILGLRLTTKRGQVLRALLEGVAFEMRLNVDILEQAGLDIREFRAIGGGAKSAALTQLKADVLNRPITTLAVTEAGCLGVAMLACAAQTGAEPRELAQTWVQTTSVVEPDPRRASLYTERFGAYKELYPLMREFSNRTA
ncbi:MAG: FGGY-family carbohydrate kinase [Planctomycetota bacterium]